MKMSLEAIRVNMGKTRSEMAELLNVNVDRYNRLATGESKMLATELIQLHAVSGVPYENIDVMN
jgi:transcriptional regulator with XRE-family HTH domain